MSRAELLVYALHHPELCENFLLGSVGFEKRQVPALAMDELDNLAADPKAPAAALLVGSCRPDPPQGNPIA